MSDYARDRLQLDDEDDRLPWLEPADGDDDGDGLSPAKLLAFVLGALALLAVVLAGIWWATSQKGGGEGKGEVIAAPKGEYKIPASEADAKSFQGEGDASFDASEGVERDGKIDPAKLPETPVTTEPAPTVTPKTPPAKPATKVTAPVADETKTAKTPVVKTAASTGGPMIQLGAYGSQAMAKDAWGKLSKRFDYLAPLTMSIEPVQVGATTLYRLRASAGGDAAALCGKLKVAGESCMVVR